MTYPHPAPLPSAPKKSRKTLKIIGGVIGGIVVLGVVAGIAGGTSAPETSAVSTPAPVSAPATRLCTPTAAPTPPADGSSVVWNDTTCSWDKIPGTADGVSPAPAVAEPTTEATQFPPQVEQARAAAQSYLDIQAFSHDGLVRQLSSTAGDGYPKSVATQAVDSFTVDWNAQAAKAAQSYLDFTSFSCSGLISQLDSSAGDGFTKAQATYGAHQTTACK